MNTIIFFLLGLIIGFFIGYFIGSKRVVQKQVNKKDGVTQIQIMRK